METSERKPCLYKRSIGNVLQKALSLTFCVLDPLSMSRMDLLLRVYTDALVKSFLASV